MTSPGRPEPQIVRHDVACYSGNSPQAKAERERAAKLYASLVRPTKPPAKGSK